MLSHSVSYHKVKFKRYFKKLVSSSTYSPKKPNKVKIFIIVGTQEPFDRMIKAIDEWAVIHKELSIFAQISKAQYQPKSFPFTDFIAPELFDLRFREADLIISHAGMGTIISALANSKPIIVMPRLAANHEHRNDHQVDTAKSFEELGFVKAVYTEQEMHNALDSAHNLKTAEKIGPDASPELIKTILSFIDNRSTAI